MSRKVCMQNEFFDFVVFGIEEQILEVNIYKYR